MQTSGWCFRVLRGSTKGRLVARLQDWHRHVLNSMWHKVTQCGGRLYAHEAPCSNLCAAFLMKSHFANLCVPILVYCFACNGIFGLNCEAAASVHLGSARHDHVVQTGSLQKGILRFSTWANSHKVAAMNPGIPKKRQLLDGTSPCTAYPVATFIACGFLPCHLAGSRASFDFGSHPGGQISPTRDFLSPSDPQKVTKTPRLW